MGDKTINFLVIILIVIIMIYVVRETVKTIKYGISEFKIRIIKFKGRLNFKNSSYFKVTQLPYNIVKHNSGYYGEYLTYLYLKKFEDSGAKFLFNLYIPKGDNNTSEIDLLMVCSKGIFVFESKNFSGWIFGDETRLMWYQTLRVGYGESEKNEFYNPVMQNKKHIEHLKSVLNITYPIQSIVVFSDRCSFKNIQLLSNERNVIHRYEVYKLITSICNQNSHFLLSKEEIEGIYATLYPYSQVNSKTKIEHSIKIKNDFTHQPDSLSIEKEYESISCPLCGGKLVLRTAKKGGHEGEQFYGCSNYPKCRYIKNI